MDKVFRGVTTHIAVAIFLSMYPLERFTMEPNRHPWFTPEGFGKPRKDDWEDNKESRKG